MEIISIKENEKYLREYIKLCSLEWGSKKTKEEMDIYVENKLNRIFTEDKVISVLGLIDKNALIGFISIFKYDGDEEKDLTPWYATMYIKKEYRGMRYSQLLNNAILNEAKELNYNKIYLKSNLENYYEKFGAKYIENLDNGEKLFYIDL